MELRLEQVRDAAEPTPPVPAPPQAHRDSQKGGEEERGSKATPPPAPPTIAAAVKTLSPRRRRRPSSRDRRWSQARVVELSDKAAVAKAVKDLAFLSAESPA